MLKVAIYGQAYKNQDKTYFEDLVEELNQYDFKIYVEEKFSAVLSDLGVSNLADYPLYSSFKDLDDDFVAMITLGGDGTILRALTYIQDLDIPILGINTGRLGFLATVQKEAMTKAIDCLARKSFNVEKRSLLEVRTSPDKEELKYLNFALNDVTLTKKNTTSMIGVKAYLNEEYLTTYWADGLIISTPTGSTGYSLSCMGPVITPSCENFLITSIAPHNLNSRPIVIPDNLEIKLKLSIREDEFLMSLDSRVTALPKDTEIYIKKASFKAQIIQLHDQTFVKTLRSKLLWGEDTRNYKFNND